MPAPRLFRDVAGPRVGVCALLALYGVDVAPPAEAQPAPSFLASCEDLRGALAGLGRKEGELVTISVQGVVTIAQRDEALAYLAVCAPPHPRVLCVTYELSGRQVGDTVMVSGALDLVDPDHVMLDPCLASPPEARAE